jgi:predicted transposase/invertase (TIGR01784 family)
MIPGIDPKVDYAFKHLFGREETRPILMDLLDSVLNPAPGHHIRDIELLNPFNPKEALDDKLSILDIKARDQTGRQFNVEMQMLASAHYDQRILYYACRLHQQQLHEGEGYVQLRPTVSVSILNYLWFRDLPDHHLCFRLLEQKHHILLTGGLEFHILEVPKFRKSAAELGRGLDLWLYFLREAEMMEGKQIPPALLQNPMVVRALQELKMLSQSEVERERYEARRKALLDQNTLINWAGRQREEGRQEGRQEGRAEGEKIGLIGTIRVCERLLQRPETPTEQLAGLSLEELAGLSKELEEQILKAR